MCPVEALEEEVKGGSSSQLVLCRATVERSTRWAQLGSALSHAFTSHLHILCGDPQAAKEEAQRPPLGLGPKSIASVLIGEDTYTPLLNPLFLKILLSSLFLHFLVYLAGTCPCNPCDLRGGGLFKGM